MLKYILKVSAFVTLSAAIAVDLVGVIITGRYGILLLYFVLSLQAFIPVFLFTCLYGFLKEKFMPSFFAKSERCLLINVLASFFSQLFALFIFIIVDNEFNKHKELWNHIMSSSIIISIIGFYIAIIYSYYTEVMNFIKKILQLNNSA